jgi:cytochrome P450
VLSNLFFKILTPSWAVAILSRIHVPYLTSRVKETKLAFEELRSYMLDIIASARDAITNGNGNIMGEAAPALLRNLVEANIAQEGSSNRRLTDDELLSDVFVRLSVSYYPLT